MHLNTEKNNEMGCNGREFYQRCAKTLLQVGDVKDQTFGILLPAH
jgi:hypothetical protein